MAKGQPPWIAPGSVRGALYCRNRWRLYFFVNGRRRNGRGTLLLPSLILQVEWAGTHLGETLTKAVTPLPPCCDRRFSVEALGPASFQRTGPFLFPRQKPPGGGPQLVSGSKTVLLFARRRGQISNEPRLVVERRGNGENPLFISRRGDSLVLLRNIEGARYGGDNHGRCRKT